MLPGGTATASRGRAKGGTSWDLVKKLRFDTGMGAGLQMVKKEGARLLYSFQLFWEKDKSNFLQRTRQS